MLYYIQVSNTVTGHLSTLQNARSDNSGNHLSPYEIVLIFLRLDS